MNNKLLYVGLASAVCVLSGCVMVEAGYSPNSVKPTVSCRTMEPVPVSYSVSMKYMRTDILFDPDQDDMIKKVGEALEASGLFSSVTYASAPQNDTYHFSFDFHVGAQDEEKSIAAGLVAGYSFLLIPVWEVCSFDGAVTMYLKNKPIYGTSETEKVTCYIWLPLAPVGLIWNNYFAWNAIEDGVVNNLIRDVAKEHINRFAD